MKKQSFFKGAVILMAANAVSKILGAVFKIPMANIVREEGMAVYNTAFQIYIMLLGFVICGFPLAISRLTAEYAERGEKDGIEKTVRAAERILILLGLAGSAAMYMGAEFFSYAAKEPQAVFAVKMLAPSVFFVAWGTVYKSCFQGCGNMLPTAVSQVTEAFIKLAAGFCLCVWLVSRSKAAAAGGAALGVTVGEAAATLILLGLYEKQRRRIRIGKKETLDTIKLLASAAFPILLCSLISNMASLTDISVIRFRLSQCVFGAESGAEFLKNYGGFTDLFTKSGELRMSNEGAGWLYGAYSGFAMTVFNLPLGIIAAFGVSVMPVIAGSLGSGNIRRAERAASGALRITSFCAVPCAVLVFFFSEELLEILFHNTASARLLKILAPGIAAAALTQISAAILHSAGRIFPPFLISFFASALKICIEWALAADGRFHIEAVPAAFTAAELLCAAGNFWCLNKIIGLKIKYRDIIIKPAAGAAVMIFILHLLKKPANAGVYGLWGDAVAAAAGTAAYFLTELAAGGISKKDINFIRRG